MRSMVGEKEEGALAEAEIAGLSLKVALEAVKVREIMSSVNNAQR
jgi:hypothetical protein